MSNGKVETLKEFNEWYYLNRDDITKKVVFEVACDTIQQLEKELQEYKFDWSVWDKNKELQAKVQELEEELKFFKEHAHPYDIKMWEKGGKK